MFTFLFLFVLFYSFFLRELTPNLISIFERSGGISWNLFYGYKANVTVWHRNLYYDEKATVFFLLFMGYCYTQITLLQNESISVFTWFLPIFDWVNSDNLIWVIFTSNSSWIFTLNYSNLLVKFLILDYI